MATEKQIRTITEIVNPRTIGDVLRDLMLKFPDGFTKGEADVYLEENLQNRRLSLYEGVFYRRLAREGLLIREPIGNPTIRKGVYRGRYRYRVNPGVREAIENLGELISKRGVTIHPCDIAHYKDYDSYYKERATRMERLCGKIIY